MTSETVIDEPVTDPAALRAAILATANALEALPDDVFPEAQYTLGRDGSREAIDSALEAALRKTGLTKRELYSGVREVIAQEATLPLPDIVQLLGRVTVLARLRGALEREQ